LLDRGGVYADLDTIFVAAIADELYDKPFVIGREADVYDGRTGAWHRSLCNALLMGERGSVFARAWRTLMPRALAGWSHHSTLLPQQLSEQHPALVHIEPERTFYPYRCTRRDFDRLFVGCETDLEGVCSIHLWNHLWFHPADRLFSDFHGGLINEHRLRRVDTTYNLLARPFLP
jgi:hypothetical protein